MSLEFKVERCASNSRIINSRSLKTILNINRAHANLNCFRIIPSYAANR